MYIKGSREYKNHREIYGPQSEFGYKDFIPLFRAERFDPDEWARLFAEAGAKYCVPVAEHHDGFQMYRSDISHWNAYEMGPKRDVLGELGQALAQRGIVNGASSHRVEHWFFMGHGKEFDSDVKEPMSCGDFYWPAMPEPHHHDLFSEPAPTAEFLEDWLVRCCEIVDRYQPKQFYFDWWIQHSAVKPYLRKFTAYYYNRAAEWGEEVTVCYKHDAYPFGTATVDIERGKFAEAQPFFWQTDTAIARNSWCWTENNSFKSPQSLVRDLIDIVSKNGVMLLNVGPKPDGSISEEDRAVLEGIGRWLAVNGEAVYNTSIWRKASEGPTKTKEGQFTDGEDTVFTPEDIRFTAKGSSVFATVLQWPEDGKILIRSLAERDASKLPVFHGIIRDVSILGHDNPKWTRDGDGLHVTAPSIISDYPVVIKISLD
jgi:alpha-L-fucosidase